jgi:hypothetical protein
MSSFSNIDEVWGKPQPLAPQPKLAPDNNILNGYAGNPDNNILNGYVAKAPQVSSSHSQPHTQSKQQISLSDTSMMGVTTETENYDPHYSPYAQVSGNKDVPKSALKKKTSVSLSDSSMSMFSDTNTSDTMDTLSDFEISDDKPNECKKTISHIKKCSKCNHKLKKLINRRVKNKCDDIIFEYHKKFNYHPQVNPMNPSPMIPQMGTPPPISSYFPSNNTQSTSHPLKDSSNSLKETALLVVGGIIALIIIYFIARMFK